jgi:hypothetical protein
MNLLDILRTALWGYRLLYDQELKAAFQNVPSKEAHAQLIRREFGRGNQPQRSEAYDIYRLIRSIFASWLKLSEREVEETSKQMFAFRNFLNGLLNSKITCCATNSFGELFECWANQ